jgi:hypothetical protein
MPAAYTITDDVLSTDYEDEAVLVHLDSKRCFRLNDTAAEIWRGIAGGLDRDALVARICDTFEVDEKTAAAETDRLLEDLTARRLIRRAQADAPAGG